MSSVRRVTFCIVFLGFGLAAQAALEKLTETERPPLRQSLSSLPMTIGEWVGHDEPLDEKIKLETQATEFINRVYESETRPGKRLALWINYSVKGDNLRHSPEVCLPSRGYTKLESECRVISIERAGDVPTTISRLGYGQGGMVQGVGFWYYIFGEGQLERYVRGLPITSRSSHGRTTRGSSMTVEVFDQGNSHVDDATLQEFTASLVEALQPILPLDRAQYFVP
jgi:hypothetical protein